MDAQRREQLEAQLSAYLDDELTARERAEVEAFLAGDAGARKLLAELEATVAVVRSLPRAKASDDLMESIRARMEKQALLGERGANDTEPAGGSWNARPWAAAAIIALTVTAGYVMWPGQDNSPVSSENHKHRTLALEDQAEKDDLLFGATDDALPAELGRAARSPESPGVKDGTLVTDAMNERFRGQELTLKSEETRYAARSNDLKKASSESELRDDLSTHALDEAKWNEDSDGAAAPPFALSPAEITNSVVADQDALDQDGDGVATLGIGGDSFSGIDAVDCSMGSDSTEQTLTIVNGDVEEPLAGGELATAGSLKSGAESDLVGLDAGYSAYGEDFVIPEGIEAPETVVVELAFLDAADRAQAMNYLQGEWRVEASSARASGQPAKGGRQEPPSSDWSWFMSIEGLKVARDAEREDLHAQTSAGSSSSSIAPDASPATARARSLNAEGRMARQGKGAPPAGATGDHILSQSGDDLIVSVSPGQPLVYEACSGDIDGVDASGRPWRPTEIEHLVRNVLVRNVNAAGVSLRGVSAEDRRRYGTRVTRASDAETWERQQGARAPGDRSNADISYRGGGFGSGQFGTTQQANEGFSKSEGADEETQVFTGRLTESDTRVREQGEGERAAAPPTRPTGGVVMGKGGPSPGEARPAPPDALPPQQQELSYDYSQQAVDAPAREQQAPQNVDTGPGDTPHQPAATQSVQSALPSSEAPLIDGVQSSTMTRLELPVATRPASQPACYLLNLYFTLSPRVAEPPASRPAQDAVQTGLSPQAASQPAAR